MELFHAKVVKDFSNVAYATRESTVVLEIELVLCQGSKETGVNIADF